MYLDKKSLLAIEKVISCINELNILTKDKSAEYFYDRFDLIALLDLLETIRINLNKISHKIKKKYDNIDWEIIEKRNSENIGVAWELASKTLKEELLDDLNRLLEIEIPTYYSSLCNKKHKEFIKHKSERKTSRKHPW